MKLINKKIRQFIEGNSYYIDNTIGAPVEYFRRPINEQEDPSRHYRIEKLDDGEEDHMSSYDVCIKSFKMIIEIWE